MGNTPPGKQRPGSGSAGGGGGGSAGMPGGVTSSTSAPNSATGDRVDRSAVRRRGSLSSRSGPPGAALWEHATYPYPGPLTSPHTYPPGTDPSRLPHRSDKVDSRRSKPFRKYERDLLKSTFADLASRSASGKAIDKETFLKFFCSDVPGMIGERLFRVFNKSNSGSLDLDEFLTGLASYCRGTPEQKVGFIYQIFNLAHNGRCTRQELETMCNSILFAAEALARHQSVAAAHAAAAEASVAKAALAEAAAAAASGHTADGAAGSADGSGVIASPERDIPASSALLYEHLRAMRNRAHSPSFQYSPPPDGMESFLARTAADVEQADKTAATVAQRMRERIDEEGLGAGIPADPHDPSAPLSAGGLSSEPIPTLPAFNAGGGGGGGAGLSGGSAVTVSLAALDPLSPQVQLQEPDWMHSERVKAMVDDAFNTTLHAPPPHPSDGAGSTAAHAGTAAAAAASGSSGGAGGGPHPEEGLSMYQFGAWLQSHPEIMQVLDAAFMGQEGLSYLSAPPPSEYAATEEAVHRNSESAAPDLSATIGGGGGAVAGGGATNGTSSSSSGGAPAILGLRLPLSTLGTRSASASSSMHLTAAPSPLSAHTGVSPSLLSLPSNGGSALPMLDAPAAVASSKSSALDDKRTWKDGPRLSISGIPAVSVGVPPGVSGALLPVSTRSAGPSFIGSSRVSAGSITGNGGHGSASSPATATGAPPHQQPPRFGAAGPSLSAGNMLPSTLRCDACDPNSAAKYCVACGKSLPAVTSNAATLSLPDCVCASCLAHPPSSPTPRYCLCCGTEYVPPAPPGPALPPPSKLLVSHWSSVGGVRPSSGSGSAAAPGSLSSVPLHHHVVEGYLKKVGARLRTIISRWYVIRDNFLYSYSRPSNGGPDELQQQRPKHVIFLEGCFVEPVNHEDRNAKLKYGIEIILSEQSSGSNGSGSSGGSGSGSGAATKRKSKILYASTAESRQTWLEALRCHANVHDIEEFYTLGPELGVGRFSSVREGVSKASGRKYAVKIIDKCEINEAEREALRTEVAVLKLVHHPSIIRLKSVFESRKQMFLVLNLVGGGDLLERLQKRKRFTEGTTQNIMAQLIEVVHYLHVRGIVHRDLKPENILCKEKERERDRTATTTTNSTTTTMMMTTHSATATEGGASTVVTPMGSTVADASTVGAAAAAAAASSSSSAAAAPPVSAPVSAPAPADDNIEIMLADFGLGAFALPDQSMKLPCGTLAFTAPEVLSGRGYGLEVDLWSLGVIAFLLVRGRLPFDGKSSEEIRERILKGAYSFDDPVWHTASAEIKHLIKQLLTVDPAQRLTCAQALEHPFFKMKFERGSSASTSAHAAAAEAGSSNTSTLAVPEQGVECVSASAPITAAGASSVSASDVVSAHTTTPAVHSIEATAVVTPQVAPLPTSQLQGTLPAPVPHDATAPVSVGASAAASASDNPSSSQEVHAPSHGLRICSTTPSLDSSSSSSDGTGGTVGAMPGAGLEQLSIATGGAGGTSALGLHSSQSSVTDLPSLLVPGSALASPLPIDGFPLDPSPSSRASRASPRHRVGAANATNGNLLSVRTPATTERASGRLSPSSILSPIPIMQFPFDSLTTPSHAHRHNSSASGSIRVPSPGHTIAPAAITAVDRSFDDDDDIDDAQHASVAAAATADAMRMQETSTPSHAAEAGAASASSSASRSPSPPDVIPIPAPHLLMPPSPLHDTDAVRGSGSSGQSRDSDDEEEQQHVMFSRRDEVASPEE